MSRKIFLNDRQIKERLDDLLASDASEEEVSEGEDNLIESEHSTDSEQELIIEPNEDIHSYEVTSNIDFSSRQKTRSQNIIRFKSGPTIAKDNCIEAKNLFFKFISNDILNEIVL